MSGPIDVFGICKVFGVHLADFVGGIKAVRPEVWALLTNDGEIQFED